MGSGVELFIISSQRYQVIGRNALSCGMVVAMHSTLLLDAFKIKRNKDSASFLHLEKGLHGTPQTIFHLSMQPYPTNLLAVTLHDYIRLPPIGRAPDQPLGCCKGRHNFEHSMNFTIFTSHNSFPLPCRLERLRYGVNMKGVPSRPLTFAAAILRY